MINTDKGEDVLISSMGNLDLNAHGEEAGHIDDQLLVNTEETKEEEEAKYELSLLYDDRMKKHPANHEEIPVRCTLIYSALEQQNCKFDKLIEISN